MKRHACRMETNANSKTTTMEYDFIGRMTKRIAPKGTAEWFFDNPCSSTNCASPSTTTSAPASPTPSTSRSEAKIISEGNRAEPGSIVVKEHYWSCPENGTGGNAIDLLTQVMGMSFNEAMSLLQRFG